MLIGLINKSLAIYGHHAPPTLQLKKEGRRESKKYKNMLSAQARNSQANILHLDQKAVKCMTCKWLCGKV